MVRSCPSCAYPLQPAAESPTAPGADFNSARADEVRCPECGSLWRLTSIAAELLPWYQSPRFNRILSPAAWLLLWSALAPIAAGVVEELATGVVAGATAAAWIAVIAVGALVWVNLLLSLSSHCAAPNPARLSLLAHVLLLLGGASMVCLAAPVIGVAAGRGWSADLAAVGGIALLLAGAFGWLALRLERVIAQRCRIAASALELPVTTGMLHS